MQAVHKATRRALLNQLLAERIVHIDDGRLQWPVKQPGLGSTVLRHVPVVVKVIAAKVGKYGQIELQVRHPALVQGMGRHLHAHPAGTLVTQLRQLLLHGDGIGRRHAVVLQLTQQSATQGTDHAAGAPQRGKCLRQHLGDAGLAVGTGNADQPDIMTGLLEKAPGNGGNLPSQILDRQHDGGALALLQVLRTEAIGAFIGHRHCTGLDGVGNVRATVMAQTGHSQKQTARTGLTTVERQVIALHRHTCPVGEKLIKAAHPREPSVFTGGGSSTCCSAGRSSGVTFSRRKAPDMISPKTGAATRPP